MVVCYTKIAKMQFCSALGITYFASSERVKEWGYDLWFMMADKGEKRRLSLYSIERRFGNAELQYQPILPIPLGHYIFIFVTVVTSIVKCLN